MVRLSLPTDGDWEVFEAQYYLWRNMDFLGPPKVRGMAWQYEIGGETERPHFQAYIVLEKPMRQNAFMELFNIPHQGQSYYIRGANNPNDAYVYCTKDDETRQASFHNGDDGGPFEWGDLTTSQGKTNVLDLIAEELWAGDSLREIAFAHPAAWIVRERGIKSLAEITAPEVPALIPKRVIVWYGDSGAGKSVSATLEWPKANRVKWVGGQFVQGYDGADAVIMDEYSPANQFPWDQFLEMTASPTIVVNTKNGKMAWTPKIIVIISNMTWREWYPHQGYLRPLERRISCIVQWTGEWPNSQDILEFNSRAASPPSTAGSSSGGSSRTPTPVPDNFFEGLDLGFDSEAGSQVEPILIE